jgi:hypothetical protein
VTRRHDLVPQRYSPYNTRRGHSSAGLPHHPTGGSTKDASTISGEAHPHALLFVDGSDVCLEQGDWHDHRQGCGPTPSGASVNADHAHKRPTLVSVLAAVKARIGRPVLLNVRPPRDHRADEAGRCAACGADTTFVFNSWTIGDDLRGFWADPSVSHAYTRRESVSASVAAGACG